MDILIPLLGWLAVCLALAYALDWYNLHYAIPDLIARLPMECRCRR